MFFIAVSLFLICIFALFLGYQFYLFLGPPKLQVVIPADNQIFQESVVEVQGRSDQDAVVYINKELINLDDQGNFSKETNLSPGENTVLIEAVSRRGRKSIIERKVFYQFP